MSGDTIIFIVLMGLVALKGVAMFMVGKAWIDLESHRYEAQQRRRRAGR